MRTVIHRWTHINLNEPRIKMFIDHKVVANEFTAIPPSRDIPLTAFYTPDNDVFHAFLDGGPAVLADVGCEFSHWPHVAGDLGEMELCVVFLDWIVCEMDESVVDVL